ncbi:isochorismatase family protein [Mesorhizobium sp. M4B.F.Ca.ET.089.01.1.1]|uniref:isochorismatase family protein n=1 Tax=Mesorhizobium sp. M4B.F.Ca.ET.089.01.1.1 TaxID=2496662 RepID=UPI000FE38512|nr:isochorismatase family protein [Mesorhizobium sp. M4B.F.Ca.ET.089.01.1.1]RWX59221.1 isochorismatase family protein [Mesorhizobium sp. M4B.F.Ca.ET.089.01.1.1]
MPESSLAPLIVIDLQTGMFDGRFEPPIHDAEGIVARARAVIDWARESGRKVAFIRHDGPQGDPLAPGASGWPVWPELGQADDEPTFGKRVGDAFSNEALGEWVAGQGAGAVILLGAQSDFCVAATLKGAMERGLGVTVVSDAHSTLDTPAESAAAIIARHNAAFEEAGAKLATAATLSGR